MDAVSVPAVKTDVHYTSKSHNIFQATHTIQEQWDYLLRIKHPPETIAS